MAENTGVKTKLTFDEDVIRKIAGLTAQQVDGIISLNGGALNEFASSLSSSDDPTKGISAEVGEKQVSLKLNASIEYGANAREVFHQVTRKVSQALTEMTGLELVQLELHVDDVKTKEELKPKSKNKS